MPIKVANLPRATRKHVETRLKQLQGNIAEGRDRIYRAKNALADAEHYTARQEHELNLLTDYYEFS